MRRQTDFAAVRNEGRRQYGAAVVFSMRRRGAEIPPDLPRFAVVASRRVGGAVVRNRLKRQLRALFREFQGMFPRDADIVVTLKPAAASAGFEQLGREFLQAAQRLNRGSAGGPAPATDG